MLSALARFTFGLVHRAKNGPPTCGAPGHVLKWRTVVQFQVDSVSVAMGMQPENPFLKISSSRYSYSH